MLADIYYRSISNKNIGVEQMRLIKGMLHIKESERMVLATIQKSEFLAG